MLDRYSPMPKKKRKANNFRPSTSLAEFAEMNDLDLLTFEALVDVKPQYTRGTTKYYHIVALNEWLANNEVSL